MKVFISWSGDQSKAIAEKLKAWLPQVIQKLKPFVSAHDIESGAMWLQTLTNELAVTDTGILCINAENLDSSWILFEAGALSKGLEENAVSSILFGIPQSAVKPPISFFQNTVFGKDPMLKLITDMNKRLKTEALDESLLRKSFDAFWPELENSISDIVKKIAISAKPKREQYEMLEEILSLCRAQTRTPSLATLTDFSKFSAADWVANPINYSRLAAALYPTKTPPLCKGCEETWLDLRRCLNCNELICSNCQKKQVPGTACNHKSKKD
jgi:hypothetical protein